MHIDRKEWDLEVLHDLSIVGLGLQFFAETTFADWFKAFLTGGRVDLVDELLMVAWSSATEACSHAEEPDKTNVTLNALENGGKENLPTKGMKSPGNPSDSDIASSSNGSKVAVRDEGNFTLMTKFQVGQSFNPLLGPQAQPLDWPSRACWASAFGPLTGSKTVDKYHRESTIFNPILCIDDFNCYESEHGTRKRRAMDGFYMIPGIIPSPETIPTLDDNQNTLANTELQPDIEETTASIFSPGSSVTPKSLKKRGANSSSRGKTNHYRNLWNAKCFDLAIDLDNHFVVIEKKKSEHPSCVKEADKNALLGSIESDPPGTKWNFIGIYGPPTMSGREDFWNRIGDSIVNESSPTVLIGDLNGTLADHECLNYANQRNSARYSFDLRGMVARTGLVDLGCLGGKFTWFQKASQSTRGASVRRARLDKALASIDWRILFPNAVVELLTVGTSDHKPILLNTEGGTRCLKPQFKYELMWGRDPRCFWVVRNAWRDNLHHDPIVNLYRKLRKTKEHLKTWNKTHFGKIQQQVFIIRNNRWNSQMVREWFNPTDAAATLNIDLPDERVEDSWIWIVEQNGNFSIRSACRLINGDHSANTESPNLPPNVEFYDFMATSLCIVEAIWRERNQRVHAKKDTELVLIIDSVRQKILDHVMVASNRVEEVLEWTPPPPSWACCNSDVAISATGCVLSAVIRDDLGTILSITVKTGMATSPKLAEAHAVCLAAEKAIELGLKNIIFQCDNRCVVKAFEAPISNCVAFSLQEAKSRFLHACDKLNDWGIVHISRKCNYMAHNIAKWASNSRVIGCINPEALDESVLDDLTEWDLGDM
ncbi:hypothetical protein F8388_023490 [Cannabis sativa]|uniref:RNase H type-1 domain-containing protein n=1 Tax=Cannabis sativa TaxID=3483 RepID=A0A7J6GLY0_CANSA|nr:hypothetical protein F8388_023490 [Cannabis sativa]